ncbi:MogA/MoaB family molybdenum cofactor biosynthesis protein [Salimicrobium salexigens]|uniref:Molybdenum cofactor biosynthesis protein B n=1 Tax=Salimicrobium salexigens TaxID=908941 RepID=A0ABY1L1P5_9BACI|nr:molybdenum cofactor biosynthesis protein B [Salimicrobium salexigens]SIS88496.1 molybdenum cofactor biosynthesis protein B [Salimicrobium salexigens]
MQSSIIVVSDTRTEKTDRGGKEVMRQLEESGRKAGPVTMVRDEIEEIRACVREEMEKEMDVLFLTGGSGIAKRDVTPEAVEPLYEKKIDGFGELFRLLSYQQDVGTKAMFSRASAGVIGNVLVFLMPGSVKAVSLAMEELILPELDHFYSELHK